MINLLALTETGLNANTAVELRKAAAELGIKGASKGRKADLILAIMDLVYAAQDAKKAEDAELAEKYQAVLDAEKALETSTAPEATDEAAAKKARRSRLGMVIVAKGTEIHKSATFKAAAEASGWSVELTVTVETVEEDGEEFEIEKHTAVATREGDSIVMVWNGRAYDYPASQGFIGGKDRKIRNLKEALRVIAN